MATIIGTDDPNTLTGTIEADVINGLAGNDVINALTRPILPGSGIDIVDGGAGSDTLVVNAAAETQSISLGTGFSPTFQVRSLSGNFHIDAYDMERIQITGGTGNDTIATAELPGTINGGGGIDHWLADLGGLFTGVTFTLGTTASIAAAGLTSILSIERLSLTTGLGNDTITGGAQADFIATGDGDDIINARTRPTVPGSGIDVVDGGADFDTLIVDATAETQGVQLFAGSSPSFQVRSISGNFHVDAYGIEAIRFTGGAGDDEIGTGDRGGTVNGKGGIDHWLADLSALTGDVVFTLGSTTAIAAAGLTSILGLERITLTTGDGNDTITGGAQADTIRTGEGDDIIDARTRPTTPGSGIDMVDAGGGFDTLIVNAIAETQSVQLFSGASPSFQLRSNSGNFHVDAYSIERILFTGGSADDAITTGARGGTVNGRAGIDHWLADLGALTSDVTFALGTTTSIAAAGLTSILGLERITLTTGAGNDTVTGGAQADTIVTGQGHDTIDAKTRPTAPGSGIDFVDGGAGIDTLVVNAAAESQGVQLFAGLSPSFQLRSTSGNFYVDAYSIEKIRFSGGTGNDVFDTSDRGVTVNGGGGIDHWIANLGALTTAVTFTLGSTTAIGAAGLTAIAAIEQITLRTGSGNDVIVGGAQADSLSTGNGNDTIDAKTRPTTPGSGIDVVDGGGGTDTLVVNAVTETLGVQIFAGSSPSFQVRSDSGKYYVDAFNLEVLDARTGNGADTISGKAGADLISTAGGNDALSGGDGNDSLNAGAGLDTLTGGRGADLLTGGTGNDVFDYNAIAESFVLNATIDSIADFAAGDKIDLSTIDADGAGSNGDQAFSLIGAAAFSNVRGQLRSVGGMVEADVNGDGAADFRVLLGNGATLAAADFVL